MVRVTEKTSIADPEGFRPCSWLGMETACSGRKVLVLGSRVELSKTMSTSRLGLGWSGDLVVRLICIERDWASLLPSSSPYRKTGLLRRDL